LHAVLLLLYITFTAEFVIRFNLDRPSRSILENGALPPRDTLDGSIKTMIIGVFIIVFKFLLLIRSIYRIARISEGWSGAVLSTQWLFGSFLCPLFPDTEILTLAKQDVFDSGAIALALVLSQFHPGSLLRGPDVLEVDSNKLQMLDHGP
jgi:hypothetical protein